MRKTIFIALLLLFLAGVLSAVEVTIGSAATYNISTDYPAPYGNYWKNSRMQYLVTKAELNDAGGGAGNITSLAFNNAIINGCGARTLTIKLGHTTLSELTTTFVTGLTQVFTTTSYQPVTGWNTCTFATPYNWDGVQNIVVEVYFGDLALAYTYNASSFYTSTSPANKCLMYYSDTTDANAVTMGTLSNLRTNMRFNMQQYVATVPPNPAIIGYPGDGATLTPYQPTLTWGSGGGAPTGYKLYFGTSARTLTYIGDLGNVTSWTPPAALLAGTNYSWQVIPYNAIGDAAGCPTWTFTTAPEGTVIIGNGTDIPDLPIHANFGYTYSQVIYQQTEVGGPGTISSIAYYWNGAAASTLSNDWVIYMGHTANSEFTSYAGWLPLSSLTQVFSGAMEMAAVPGWINITLDTPFYYDGTRNLVIAVDENEAGFDSPYGSFFCTATSYNRALLYFSNTTNPDPAAPPAALYIPNHLANVMLVVTPPVEATVGTGTNYNSNMGYPAPYGNYYKNSRVQYLVTKADLNAGGGGAGNITSLAFNNDIINGCGARTLTIKLGHTTLTELTATFVTGLTQVLTTTDYQPVTGWNTHTFSTPFAWNGTDNVVVEVYFGNLALAYTHNASTYFTSTTGVATALYYRNDTLDANAQTAGTTSTNRANMRFAMAALLAPGITVDPASYTFGDVEQLNSAQASFTVTNTGGSIPPLTISSVYITDDPEGNFSVVAGGLPVSLDSNDTYNITVTFTPQTVGAKAATLNIVDNLTRAVNTVPLAGTGIPEQISNVFHLNGTIQNGEDVVLTWVVATGQPGWINYDNGTNSGSLGVVAYASFDAAIKFASATMLQYSGMQITHVKIYPKSSSTTYTLEIWTGADGSLAPATLVYIQALAGLAINAWNDITLTTPYPISGSEAVWVGYNCALSNVSEGAAGLDTGPAVAGWGDLYCFGGVWSSMATSYGINSNWNIQAYVDHPTLRGTAHLLGIPVPNNQPAGKLRGNPPPLIFPATGQKPEQDVASHSGLSVSAAHPGQDRALRGYNVFRNNVQINPDLVPNTTYTDYGLALGTYEYKVQAVYYSGASTLSAPWTAVITPFELPFIEDWSSGSYTTQKWGSTAANWGFNIDIGNPAPGAQFSWNPNIYNYTEYLTSWPLNGIGSAYVNVSFDLSLDNWSTLAENNMALEVWNGSAWNTVASWSSFDNAGEGWPFANYNYDISAYAAGNVFKIRFKAYGVDSYEIDYWYIDNIIVSNTPVTLPAPVVTISAGDPYFFVSWEAVPGATWYALYTQPTEPYGTYQYMGWLSSSTPGFSLYPADSGFYKVTAHSGPLPVGRMLEGSVMLRSTPPEPEPVLQPRSRK